VPPTERKRSRKLQSGIEIRPPSGAQSNTGANFQHPRLNEEPFLSKGPGQHDRSPFFIFEKNIRKYERPANFFKKSGKDVENYHR
jgi:hypothetical protein